MRSVLRNAIGDIRRTGVVNRVGAVVIGRNEGDRFQRCLRSLHGQVAPIVYVDSGSTDGSIEHARELGVESTVGVGIGVTGLIRAEEGVVAFSPNFNQWNEFPVGPEVGARLGCPVTVENDANDNVTLLVVDAR